MIGYSPHDRARTGKVLSPRADSTLSSGHRILHAVAVKVFEIEAQHAVGPERLAQLMELFAGAWWTASRTADDVTAMLAGSDLVIALVHRPTDRLVGFARVLTDEVYLALVLDLIVTSEARGSGLGAILIEAIVGHPRLAGVRSIELVCQPELMPFYRRWGFTERVGRSLLMRRTADPLLAQHQP
jgi:GNAT superfamily N-acetyltransferase